MNRSDVTNWSFPLKANSAISHVPILNHEVEAENLRMVEKDRRGLHPWNTVLLLCLDSYKRRIAFYLCFKKEVNGVEATYNLEDVLTKPPPLQCTVLTSVSRQCSPRVSHHWDSNLVI